MYFKKKPEKILIKMHFEKEDKIIKRLQDLLSKNPYLINEPINLNKDTILHFACFHKKTNVVKFLLEQGANPNQINIFGLTPNDLVS